MLSPLNKPSSRNKSPSLILCMKSKLSKTEVKDQIEEFFIDVKSKTDKQIKKIKKLAMSKNIPLKEKRKTFCKYCLTPYKTPKIRIKNKSPRMPRKN